MNNLIHPLQSVAWGEFRKKIGTKVIRTENFQLTIHKIPHTHFNIGYFPKGEMPNKKTIRAIEEARRDIKAGKNLSGPFASASEAISYLRKL